MSDTILVAVNDSVSSRAVVDFVANLAAHQPDWKLLLVHILRRPAAGAELMGQQFISEQPDRMMSVLKDAKEKIVAKGIDPDHIDIDVITEPYETVSDGIIELCHERRAKIIVLGRRRMSKAEEFVRGDISVKLIRALEDTAVLVVKSL